MTIWWGPRFSKYTWGSFNNSSIVFPILVFVSKCSQ
jgi:hypothetical protein